MPSFTLRRLSISYTQIRYMVTELYIFFKHNCCSWNWSKPVIGSCHLSFQNESADVVVIPLCCRMWKKKIKKNEICKIIHTNMFLMWATGETSWSITNGLQHWSLNCEKKQILHIFFLWTFSSFWWSEEKWRILRHRQMLYSTKNPSPHTKSNPDFLICTNRFENFVRRCEWFWSLLLNHWAQTLTLRSFATFIFMNYDTKTPVN